MAEDNKPVWLILSHAFNMDGRAGSLVLDDKISHLLNRGIEPIIISSINGKKSHKVEHHQVLPALPVALRFDLRHYLKSRGVSPLFYRLLMPLISLILGPFIIFEKMIIRLQTNWSWAISAYCIAARLIRLRKPVLIYSTGEVSAQLAAYWLNRKFNLPWIAEFHDPFVQNVRPKSSRERFAAWLEGVVCKHADIAWWFTEKALASARERHPELGDRGHCIIPGVNEQEFTPIPYRRGNHLVISYFGSFRNTRNLKLFLLSLQHVLEKNQQWKDHIRLHLYGGYIDPISVRALQDFPYPSIVKQFGRIEADLQTGESGRDKIIKLMYTSDCLLLLHDNSPFCDEFIPSKLYEYFITQRPILGLINKNPEMEHMLRDLGHWVVNAKDVDSIASALEALYSRWQQNTLISSGIRSPYTAEAATDQIINLVLERLKRKPLPTVDPCVSL